MIFDEEEPRGKKELIVVVNREPIREISEDADEVGDPKVELAVDNPLVDEESHGLGYPPNATA